MCYNGTFRFKKLDDSFWNGETFRFADYTNSATASALMSLEATRTLVRGRQPRSGLMYFLCKPMLLMFSALSG